MTQTKCSTFGKVLSDYNETGLHVKKGELIEIISKHSDVWSHCKLRKSGREGLLPNTIFKPIVKKKCKNLSEIEQIKCVFIGDKTEKNRIIFDYLNNADYENIIYTQQQLQSFIPPFGSHIRDLVEYESTILPKNYQRNIPRIVQDLVTRIKNHPVRKGLFRVNGSAGLVNGIIRQLNDGQQVLLSDVYVDELASLLKTYFRNLPEPIFPYHVFSSVVVAGKETDIEKRCAKIIDIINQLPYVNAVVLKYLMEALKVIASNPEYSMDASNLAGVWYPSLIKREKEQSENDVKETMHLLRDTITTMIDKADQIFSKVKERDQIKWTETTFDEACKEITLENKKVKVLLSDIGDQDNYETLRKFTYAGTDVFVICFSVNDPKSYAHVEKKWAPEANKFDPNIPIILCATNIQQREKNPKCITTEQGRYLAHKIFARTYIEWDGNSGEVLRTAIVAGLSTLIEHDVKPQKRKSAIMKIQSFFTSKSTRRKSFTLSTPTVEPNKRAHSFHVNIPQKVFQSQSENDVPLTVRIKEIKQKEKKLSEISYSKETIPSPGAN